MSVREISGSAMPAIIAGIAILIYLFKGNFSSFSKNFFITVRRDVRFASENRCFQAFYNPGFHKTSDCVYFG